MSLNVVAVGGRRGRNLPLEGRIVSGKRHLGEFQREEFTSGRSASLIAESEDRREVGPQSGPRPGRPGDHPALGKLFRAIETSTLYPQGPYRRRQSRAPEHSASWNPPLVGRESVEPHLYPRL